MANPSPLDEVFTLAEAAILCQRHPHTVRMKLMRQERLDRAVYIRETAGRHVLVWRRGLERAYGLKFKDEEYGVR